MIKYKNKLLNVIEKIRMDDIEDISNWIKGFERIYVIGNGGSQATAEHFVVDLLKYGNKKAYSIGSSSLITMAGNDFGYNHSFYWILNKYIADSDLVFAISTSGMSENIIRAISNNFKKTFLLTGLKGKSSIDLVDKGYVIQSDNIQIVEDVSLIICHMIALCTGGKI